MTRRRKVRAPVRVAQSTSDEVKNLPTVEPDKDLKGFYWRDHPIVVAALAVAGTFTITSYMFKEIIIPTQIAGLPALKEKLQKVEEESVLQASELAVLRGQLETLQNQSLFRKGDPFPIALDAVRLSQPIADVEAAFPGAKIKKTDGYWSVKFGFGVIGEGTYYFDNKNKKVTHVLFWLDREKKLSESFLQNRLLEALGPPEKQPAANFFEWHLKGYNVYKKDDDSFVILDVKSRPSYWPAK